MWIIKLFDRQIRSMHILRQIRIGNNYGHTKNNRMHYRVHSMQPKLCLVRLVSEKRW